MNYYAYGRKCADKGNARRASALFAEGITNGDPRCIYGRFALQATYECAGETELRALYEAFPDIMALADKGDGEACFIVGRCFETGCCTDKNVSEAVYWYRRAAARGNLDAAFNLGCIYCYDDGVKNIKKGVCYFKAAARRNHKAAQFNLAHIYEMLGGTGKAIFWYRRARRGGSANMKEKYLQLALSANKV